MEAVYDRNLLGQFTKGGNNPHKVTKENAVEKQANGVTGYCDLSSCTLIIGIPPRK